MPTASSMLSASLGLLTLIVSLAACESTPDLTGPAPSTDAAARDAGSDAGLSDDTGSDAAEHDDAGGEDSGLDAGVPGSDASGSGDTGPDGSLPPPELILVSGGVPAATVVLPQHEHPAERYAAEELARYLRAISGAELPIVVEGGPQLTGPTIEVGKTEAAVSAFPSELTGKPEGIFMEASTERLILTGGSNRAVLYAVYLFLEEKLGCRWLALDVEHVPASPSITLSPFRIVTAPAFDLRTFPARLERNWTWGQKMGFNGLFSAQTEPTDAGFSYLPAAVWGAHGYASIIPPATYSSTHPEWFPLIGGVRKTNGQLCVTAPGLAEEFAKNVAALFTADPHLQHVSISPNDGRIGWCECNACTALDQRLNGGRTTKLGLLPDAPFMGDRAFWFANKVANEVAKTHPHARLLHLAYVNYTEPPDSVTPAANVIPWLAHYAPGEYSRPIADPASAANALFNDYLTRWARKAPRLLFYSYVGKSMWWSLPRPVMSNFAADIRHLSQLGIHRYYAQSPLGDWALDGPLYYVIAKLLWDPMRDPQAIADDWIAHMFGRAAAPQVKEFYAAVELSVRKTGKPYSETPITQVPGLYDRAELDRAKALLATALASTTEGSPERARLQKVQDTFLYGYDMITCLEKAAESSAHCTIADVQAGQPALGPAIAAGTTALTHDSTAEATEFIEQLGQRKLLGVCEATGFGATESKGGRQCLNSDETGLGDGINGWATVSVPIPNPNANGTLTMMVWGTSDLSAVSVNTSGGTWTRITPTRPVSGTAQWETLTFPIPAAAMAKGVTKQTIGFGGADSQIWVASIRTAQ